MLQSYVYFIVTMLVVDSSLRATELLFHLVFANPVKKRQIVWSRKILMCSLNVLSHSKWAGEAKNAQINVN